MARSPGGIGLLAAEPEVDVLLAGRVFAFEPMLAVDGVGIFLEDMVLITEDGLRDSDPWLALWIERDRGVDEPTRRIVSILPIPAYARFLATLVPATMGSFE